MRINKFLAECGLASRRNCEALVTQGRVKVNGKKITNLATDVDEEIDLVSVDDKPVKPIGKHLYILLNKPKGYVCTTSDEHGRKTVMDFFEGKYDGKRLFPVGRLDYDTEGMLLMTTDGDLSNRLMHPRNEITKTYVAKIEGEISEADLNKLRDGSKDHDGLFTEPASINCWMPAEVGAVLKAGTPVDGLVNVNGDFIGLREFDLNGKTYKVTKTDDSNVSTVELPFEEPATTGSIKKA